MEKCEHDVLLLVSMLMKMAGRKCKKKYHLNKTEAGATSPPASTLHMARIRSVLSLSYLRNEEPSKKTNKKKKKHASDGKRRAAQSPPLNSLYWTNLCSL